MSDFLQFDNDRKALIFSQTAVRTGLPSYAVEKDWWVTEIMRIVFSLPYAEAFVFKGGTSLSKGYNLIRRFSEDIDLAIDRTFFDMPGELSRTQIKKLRKKNSKFISTELIEHLTEEIAKKELPITSIGVEPYEASDTDPLRIYITYEPLTEKNKYVTPRILLEISCRSLIEPFEEVPINSLVDQEYPDTTFTNPTFPVRTVQPQRTFLEKVFLLHEEWQKEVIRVDRLSRHLYDLERLMDTKFGKKALNDKDLYFHIIDHRSKFSAVKGVDYEDHQPKAICILPPDNVIKHYEDDYNEMKESMFSGNTLSWKELTERLNKLQKQIRELKW
ncbi:MULTISPECIES: nucleotidyl transferase AbiEii/AbiGii toxin family protein [Bacteroidota]|uniref:Nucleotidyl transferase AbiEii/AbiGii toxin family protein n=1 Tax=Zunongwangia pacifica TaxID=2911062 RepID=A0A9X1ZYA2_9FLAO|nr:MULTISPECIES: nucleotidyl transferase AbiEii/AbiGii toxin family protein [Bacteroidota]MCC4227103.1 nucleotidyl transferase AbiEii/AbiGii toxin family protein [Zunongwangia profunda]MCL6218636.1 nucleotidyl transferase AbiEii/AbiGii toxin family protein [Zunongwangia pacifica]UBZ07692.1 nucleotidyl transferase AbiEii/AbiGii toxin family protein [Salegentibacter mishustinae]|tara:strand:+ start:4088 stop:5080 length:993 start_codon:yes stop_codon:yes gene_type:complete